MLHRIRKETPLFLKRSSTAVPDNWPKVAMITELYFCVRFFQDEGTLLQIEADDIFSHNAGTKIDRLLLHQVHHFSTVIGRALRPVVGHPVGFDPRAKRFSSKPGSHRPKLCKFSTQLPPRAGPKVMCRTFSLSNSLRAPGLDCRAA